MRNCFGIFCAQIPRKRFARSKPAAYLGLRASSYRRRELCQKSKTARVKFQIIERKNKARRIFCGRPTPYSKFRDCPFGRPNARNDGRGGGRTHERYNRTDLQSASFDHLDTLPINLKPLLYLAGRAAQAFFCRIRSFFERLFKRQTALSPIPGRSAKPPV